MKKVLILEDEVNIRSFVVINLRRAGYDAIEAATGQEALDKIQQYPDIGVAILDIMLPDIDGFEVCRRIRAGSKQIGIIMLTARTQEMDKVAVWGRDYEGELKIVDVNIRRLRIKIEDDTSNPTYITTVWGFGYKWGA